MEQITKLSVEILKTHPRNTEFFDDIQGEQYEKFKKSIQEDGILTPLIVSPDMTIISGHQRYQAAKDLNLGLVPVIIKEELLDEDEKLKKLLATNFGRLKNDPVKQGRVFKQYEELCGVYHGNHIGKEKGQIVPSQEQIAKQLGVDVRTLRRLKQLNTLSPELQELISDGTVKYTTALNVWSKLPNDEQVKLIDELGKDRISTITAKATQEIINEKNKLEQELRNERSKPPKTVTEVVDNTDYSLVSKYDRLEKQFNDLKNSKNRIETELNLMTNKANAYKQDSLDYKKMKEEITYLTKQKDDIGRQIQAVTDISGLVVEIDNLLKNKLAPVRYSKALLEAKDDEIVIENLNSIITNVQLWMDEMKQIIPNKDNYVEVM